MIKPLDFRTNSTNCNQPHNTTFKASIHSPKLRLKNEDFFIRIRGYGQNQQWALVVKKTCDAASELIREKCDFDKLLSFITNGVRDANQRVFDLNKRTHTGILRAKRNNYQSGSDWDGFDLVTYYDTVPRYKGYQERLNETIKTPLKNPYEQVDLTRPQKDKKGFCLLHGKSDKVNTGMNLLKNKYKNMIDNYIPEEVSTKDLNNIVEKVAEMRWLFAHITPWERGSDAISNVFMRAIFKAFGIKASPSIKDKSFDLEAYCTNIEDYTKNFLSFFEKPLEVIE